MSTEKNTESNQTTQTKKGDAIVAKQNNDCLQTVGNVQIVNSSSVHIGNITSFNGTVEIIHASERCDAVPSCSSLADEDGVASLDTAKFKVRRYYLNIIPRSSWLAQRPMELPDKLISKPVDFVVISNTATEQSDKRAANIRIVRDTQCLHIESRGLNDIAYNFLVGCDGNVYEGRGWGVVGAHTTGYNTRSLGISFIGGFMREAPTKAALIACGELLKSAVRDGHLHIDYKLIGQCQCSSTESPGRLLFEKLQTWKHFYKMEDEDEDDDE